MHGTQLFAKLNSHPLIAYSCVIGERRPYLTALINADPVAAREWAEKRRVPFRSLSDITGEASFVAEIADAVVSVNATLNRPEQVKRFKIVADEWLPGSVLVTPTMKVRRVPIIEHYAQVVAQLYDT